MTLFRWGLIGPLLLPSIAWAGPCPDSPARVAQLLDVNLSTAKLDMRQGQTHFPANFTEADKAELLKEYKDDGRPILIFTDAHYGQKSGVVTVMNVLEDQVGKLTDHKVKLVFITPDQFDPHVQIKYQDLMFSRMSRAQYAEIINKYNPQAVHVMVEGTLGKQARANLIKDGIPFTTAYHTAFPEYLRDMVAKYSKWLAEPARKFANADLRDFHSKSEGVMVPTKSMADGLIEGGYDKERLRAWSHGVEIDKFDPKFRDPGLYEKEAGRPLEGPISIFVGRVAVEKNIEDFLKMDIPGTKVVIGGGPEEAPLREKYKNNPKIVFLGRKNYADLPKYYASADAFVFPSTTDTFGLVQLEANASGVPVVAYKVQGPVDVITDRKAGVLANYDKTQPDKNVEGLTQAWKEVTAVPREQASADARDFAQAHTWEQSTLELLYFLKRMPKNTVVTDDPLLVRPPRQPASQPSGQPPGGGN